MYHPRLIARERALLEEKYRRAFPHGLPDTPVAEARGRAAELSLLADDAGRLRRSLTPEEDLYITAESMLAKVDFRYWAERYGIISLSATALGPMFPLWRSQDLILQQLARIQDERDASGHPDGQLLLVLKARQLGASTLAEALVAHRTTTHANTQALIASDEPDSSARMYRIYERYVDHLPWFLKPSIKFDVKNAEKSFGNGSRVEVDAGKSTRGVEGKRGQIGRSGTFAVLHLTELSTWENPSQIDDALMPAIPFSPASLAIFESTAKGRAGWWPDLWRLAERGAAGPSGHQFEPVFIPWYAEPDKYWLPTPPAWTPNDTTKQVAYRASTYGPRWMGGAAVTLSREQLYWYEVSRSTAEEKERASDPGALSKFLEEYPSDPEEAFQHGGHSIFPITVREDIRVHAKPIKAMADIAPAKDLAFAWAGRRPSLDYDVSLATALRARGVDPALWAEPGTSPTLTPQLVAFDPLTDPIHLPAGTGLRLLSPRECSQHLTAVNASGTSSLRGLEDLLLIWEAPSRRSLYVIGVDVALGVEGDASAVEVLRVGTIERPTEQVAQFLSRTIEPADLAYVVDVVGRAYTGSDEREAMVAIEINNFGLQVQSDLLRHLGYTNFFVWQHEDAARVESRYSYQFGWWTSSRSRPLIVGRIIRSIKAVDPVTKQRDLTLNSPHTLVELQDFQQPAGEPLAAARAARGAHDDSLMALAIGNHVVQTLQFEFGEPIDDKRRRLSEEAFRATVAAKEGVGGALGQLAADLAGPLRLELASTPRRAQNTDVSAEEVDEFYGEGPGGGYMDSDAEHFWPG